MGTAHNFRKTIYVCIGEGIEILRCDGGEEIKPCTECTKIDQVRDNTT